MNPRRPAAAQRDVVHVPVVLEARRQGVLRVTPPVRPHHPDLPPAHRVPQRHQHAQLADDALDAALVVPHCRPPVLGHHPRQWHALRRIEKRALLQKAGPGSAGAGRPRPSPAGRRCCCTSAPARPAAARTSGASAPSTTTAAPYGLGPLSGPRSPRPPPPAPCHASPLCGPRVTAVAVFHLEVMQRLQGGQRALLGQGEDLALQVIHRVADVHQSVPRYPALRGDSRRVIRSNSSVSGSPTSRPNSVSP